MGGRGRYCCPYHSRLARTAFVSARTIIDCINSRDGWERNRERYLHNYLFEVGSRACEDDRDVDTIIDPLSAVRDANGNYDPEDH